MPAPDDEAIQLGRDRGRACVADAEHAGRAVAVERDVGLAVAVDVAVDGRAVAGDREFAVGQRQVTVVDAGVAAADQALVEGDGMDAARRIGEADRFAQRQTGAVVRFGIEFAVIIGLVVERGNDEVRRRRLKFDRADIDMGAGNARLAACIDR